MLGFTRSVSEEVRKAKRKCSVHPDVYIGNQALVSHLLRKGSRMASFKWSK